MTVQRTLRETLDLLRISRSETVAIASLGTNGDYQARVERLLKLTELAHWLGALPPEDRDSLLRGPEFGWLSRLRESAAYLDEAIECAWEYAQLWPAVDHVLRTEGIGWVRQVLGPPPKDLRARLHRQG